jgi:hypothetical protein
MKKEGGKLKNSGCPVSEDEEEGEEVSLRMGYIIEQESWTCGDLLVWAYNT